MCLQLHMCMHMCMHMHMHMLHMDMFMCMDNMHMHMHMHMCMCMHMWLPGPGCEAKNCAPSAPSETNFSREQFQLSEAICPWPVCFLSFFGGNLGSFDRVT